MLSYLLIDCRILPSTQFWLQATDIYLSRVILQTNLENTLVYSQSRTCMQTKNFKASTFFFKLPYVIELNLTCSGRVNKNYWGNCWNLILFTPNYCCGRDETFWTAFCINCYNQTCYSISSCCSNDRPTYVVHSNTVVEFILNLRSEVLDCFLF